MKIFTNLSLFLIVLLTAALTSCKKHDPDVVVRGEAKLKVVNAVSTETNQDVYVDDAKLTTTALAFGEMSSYVKIVSGMRNISFTNSPSGPTTASMNFTPSITYTTFLTSDRAGNREIVSYEDNLSNTETGKAKVKLISLTPSFITGINVSVQAGTQFVNALAYKESSNYFSIDADINLRYTVVGSGNVKTIDNSNFIAGKIYTIWFSGTTAANLEAHVIADN
ncbi:DUF4397 domain-containing protein [Pedobacter sp. BMA]|uniref:DUF4397 domain-containing protein n=1 Tax=Pedobacter sp. BMA TaxID=1663685 RepID=UPI00064B7E10|nr:DUF4397 domain-containing protein [Pedobacter sp. BMA]KLT67521.1 hypothetical protein AB669_02165 [Pedobacter sp. BMA]